MDDDLASNHSNDDMDVYEVNNDAANDDDGVAADPLDSDSDFGGSVDPPRYLFFDITHFSFHLKVFYVI